MSTPTGAYSRTGNPSMTDVTTVLAQVREAHAAYVSTRAVNDKARTRRDEAIFRAHRTGASYQDIADVLGVKRSYIYQICTREKR
jgi:hypothetical protein